MPTFSGYRTTVPGGGGGGAPAQTPARKATRRAGIHLQDSGTSTHSALGKPRASVVTLATHRCQNSCDHWAKSRAQFAMTPDGRGKAQAVGSIKTRKQQTASQASLAILSPTRHLSIGHQPPIQRRRAFNQNRSNSGNSGSADSVVCTSRCGVRDRSADTSASIPPGYRRGRGLSRVRVQTRGRDPVFGRWPSKKT
jgi:hypothetical protein